MNSKLNNIFLEQSDKVVSSIFASLPKSNIVVFEGQVGSGKTTLISKLCAHLGAIDSVSSPSYGLVNEYRTNENKIIYHFDFYRINSIEEALDIGIEEYFYSGNLCLIEWAEKIIELLPESYLKISISGNEEGRDYVIEAY